MDVTAMSIGLGLDSGGTYTDAVVIDLETGELLCKAKSPTTREDLCIGIRGAIEAMRPDLLKEVGVVSLSSTLATNSVVEGKGARVALVSIGGDYDGSCPADFSITIAGGHDLKGEELAPLDEESARSFLESMRGRIDGVAIAGYLAIRNPDHENRVRDMAEQILGIPAVCGHDLSSGLGFSERAATCIINARLIPVIDDLIRSVKDVLTENRINAPLMIVKGDGSMMGEAEARKRPVETVLSGPASSMIGAMKITGLRDAIVMDIGGTTTDIGILRDGKPRLEPEGATIGGVRTRVMAAEISTSGIGGDSRILILGHSVALSPLRVMPLCFAAKRWASVRSKLEGLRGNAPVMYAMQDEHNVVLGCEFFRRLGMPSNIRDFSPGDIKLLETLQDEPMTLQDAADIIGVHPFTFNVRRLESLGLVQRVGFTPTDVMHASEFYTEFDSEASKVAAEYLAKGARTDMEGFLEICKQRIREKLSIELMKELVSEETHSMSFGIAGQDLLMKAVSGSSDRDYSCMIKVNLPIIGIGAPAGTYIPWVGEVFGTEVLIDGNSDVGNAIGAVSSTISESISVLIRPLAMGSEEGFQAFSKLGKFDFQTLDEAIDASSAEASAVVADLVRDSGGEDITVTFDRRNREFSYGDSGNKCLMEVELTVTAAGRPRPFYAGSGN